MRSLVAAVAIALVASLTAAQQTVGTPGVSDYNYPGRGEAFPGSPHFTPGGHVRVWENMANLNPAPVPPVYTDGRNWAENINVSQANSAQNWPYFDVRNDNPQLFDVQPSIDNQGTLTFTLAKDQCGVANVTAQIRDFEFNRGPTNSYGVWGNAEWFLIHVDCVNSAPYFDIIYENCINMEENWPVMDIAVWAADVRSGPPDEEKQNLRFYVEPEDPTFFSVQPTVQITDSSTARLMFQVAPGRSGNARVRVALHDDGGTLYGGTDTYIQTLELCVADKNNMPEFSLVTDTITVYEDENNNGFRRAGFAVDISPGLGEDVPSSSTQVAQQVSFTVTVDNEQMFTQLPAIDPQGTLTFATAPDGYGHVVATVYAEDTFAPPGRTNRTDFNIHIMNVNDQPTFAIEGNLEGRRVTECTVEGACHRTYANFLTNLRSGPVNEDPQTTSVTLSMDSTYQALFARLPTIDPVTGNLEFELAQYAHTLATNPVPVTVTVRDNGGSAYGGVDVTTQTFTIEILDQPNPPTFTPRNDLTVPITVLENSGQHIAPQWATDIKATPESTSTAGLRFIVSAATADLFSVQPAITLDVGQTASLSFTPAPNRFGTTQITAYLDNPATVQNSNVYTFTITITNVNEAPTFTPGGDVVVNQNSGANVMQWATNINPGLHEESQVITFGVVCEATNPSLFSVAPSMDPQGRMRLTVAPNVAGQTVCTATAVDDGGRSNGGNDRTTADFVLTIRFINQPPAYTPGADLSMLEREREDDQTVVLNWAREISLGQGNPSTQTLEFEVVPADASWFKVPPRIDATTGTLTFTLFPYVSGVTTLSHRLRNSGSNDAPDSNESPVLTTQLIVREVNQAPRFAVGPNVGVLQNSGVYRQQAWASSISPGPAQEASQTLTFTLLPADKTLFALPPTVDPATGDLMFSTAPNMAGSTSVAACLQDDGGVENEGTDNLCRSFTIAVTAVNQAPTAVHEPEVVLLEGAGAQSLPGFLTGVTAGPEATDRTQQLVSITLTVPLGQRAAFTQLPAIALDTYTLTFTLRDDFTGSVPVTAVVRDNGGLDNGGVDALTTSFVVRALSVNQRPTFANQGSLSVRENSGAYYGLWATQIAAGPANEASQRLSFTVTVDRPQWFVAQPAVNAQGYLSFTLAADVWGDVAMTIVLRDNGGTENGGSDQSEPAYVTLTVLFVNQPPRFVAGPDLTIFQNQGPYEYRGWATAILAGPELEDLSQRAGLVFNATAERRAFFTVQPFVDVTTGTLAFTTSPDMFGDTRIFVSLSDAAGTANGGRDTSAVHVVQLRVTNVNRAPSVRTTGDVTVLEDSGDQVVRGWVTDVSAGPNEDATQTTTLLVTLSNPALFASPPRLVARDLLFTPAANAFGVAQVNVTVTDNGGTAHGGVNAAVAMAQLRVEAVNDVPTFVAGADVRTTEDAGTVSVANWLAAASAGAGAEGAQQLTAVFTMNRDDVLVEAPSLELATGTLTFTLQEHAHGTVVVSMTLRDDGGTANGGVAESTVRTFRIIVEAVNDAPTFEPGSPVLMASNAVGAYAIPWARNVSAGPREGAQTAAFEVTTLRPELFTADGQPALDAAGTLRFTARPGVTGNATLTVTLRDSDAGRSSSAYITLILTSVAVNTNIVLVLNQPFEAFNAEQLKTIVANELGVDRSQVVIVRVESGSVRVTFQLLGTPQGESSDDLTRRLVLTAQDPNSDFSRTLSIIAVNTEAATQSTPIPGQQSTATRESEDEGVNWVALIVGLFAAFVFIAIVVAAIVVFVRRRNEKKKEAQFRAAAERHGPYSYDDAPRKANDPNPIPQTFDQRAPYADDYYQDDVYAYEDAAQPGPRPPLKYNHSPSRREPATAVPVMTPGAKVYGQGSPRRSRWPQARDSERY